MARHARAWIRLAASLALAAATAGALAQEPGASPPAATGAPAGAPAAASPDPVPPVRLAFWLGRDIGITTLVTAYSSDGSTTTLKANDGLILAVGAVFLPLHDGQLETQATVGYKRASITASNGSILVSSIPVEVLEAVHLGPVRLAAGLSLQLASRIDGSGVAADLDTSFKPSLGLVLQAQYVWRLGAARRWRLELGGRFTWQTLQVSTGQQATTGANAFGVVLGAAY
jgi:hypothetical protein